MLLVVEILMPVRLGRVPQSSLGPPLVRVIVILKVFFLEAVAFEDAFAVLFPQVVALFAHAAKK